MPETPACPECDSNYTYNDGIAFVCPECAHEWSGEFKDEEQEVRDAHGNLLCDGDSVIVIKDLKVKGAGSVVKMGTKAFNFILGPSDF